MRWVPIGKRKYDLVAINRWDFAALSRATLAAMRLPEPVRIVEVGTLLATTSRALLAVLREAGRKDVQYIGIDTDDSARAAFAAVAAEVAPLGQTDVAFIQASSLDAAGSVADASCAFVFVDACHCYACARADVSAWGPKVRPGGFLAFHDTNPLQVKCGGPPERHPGSKVIGVGRALADAADELRAMGFAVHEVAKPGPGIARPEKRAWTTVFRRAE